MRRGSFADRRFIVRVRICGGSQSGQGTEAQAEVYLFTGTMTTTPCGAGMKDHLAQLSEARRKSYDQKNWKKLLGFHRYCQPERPDGRYTPAGFSMS